MLQAILDIAEPSAKKAKLDITALDLFSPPARKTSESASSTPSALLVPHAPRVNTPLDPATCLWADACLATVHRPTPAVARIGCPTPSTSARVTCGVLSTSAQGLHP